MLPHTFEDELVNVVVADKADAEARKVEGEAQGDDQEKPTDLPTGRRS